MSKHHIQNLAEQMANKGHGSSPFHFIKIPSQAGVIDNSTIQLRAYHLHQIKGGAEIDNWLEAEKILRNEEV